MQTLADISFFESLNSQPASGSQPSGLAVFNSAAAPLLQEYARTVRTSELADKFMAVAQEKNASAMLVSKLSEVKTECESASDKIKVQIGKEAASGLDAADRAVLAEFSDSELKTVSNLFSAYDAAVVKRALEMREQRDQHASTPRS